ncbi:MAG: ribonuclease P protein component [Bacteroidia bacterium]
MTTSSTLPSNSYSFNEKLKSRKILDALFTEGKILHGGQVRLLFMAQPYAEDFPVKVAVSAPKRAMKFAHDRNRMKRLMREAYRINKHALIQYCHQKKIGLAILFISRCNTPLDYHVTQEKIILLLKQIIQAHEKNTK